MNRTCDFDTAFFRSDALPLICLATSATDDVTLYAMQLRPDPDNLEFTGPKQAVPIPYARAVQARIRLHARLFHLASLLSVLGVLGLIVHILLHSPPGWLGQASLAVLAGGWLTVGLFALFSGSFAPQITLIDRGRTLRIVFPKKGETACELLRVAHLKWRGEQGVAGAALPADDWADDIKAGWDEGH